MLSVARFDSSLTGVPCGVLKRLVRKNEVVVILRHCVRQDERCGTCTGSGCSLVMTTDGLVGSVNANDFSTPKEQ